MVCSFFKKVRKDVPPHTCNRKALRKNGGLERVAKLRFTTRSRFVRSRLMPKSSAFRHSRIYRRKIRGACPRIFRIFIEIGLRPKSLIDFCNSLKHTECAVPAGTKAFLSYFLCPTKSMEKFPAGNAFGGYAAEKSTRSVPSRQGQNFPKGKFQKDLILLVESCCLGELIQGLQNLGTPCERDVFTFFLRRAKRTKKHARGLRTSGLRGAIQSSAESDFAKISGGTCRNRFCPQNAGEKALNRCERVAVLLTQD